MGSSASAYPDLSRDRERSRGSGFSGEGAPAAQATGFGGPASGFGPPPAAASYPAPPQQVSVLVSQEKLTVLFTCLQETSTSWKW